MAGKAETAKRIIDKTLALAAERGWRHTGLNDIADAAGISLTELHKHYSSRIAILEAFVERIDGAVLSGGTGTDSDESTRDRLFDVVMRRLDALRPHKAGVRAVVIGLRRDPLSLVCMMPCFARSMAWMLEAAEVSGGGVSGRMRVRGLGIIYVSVLRTWFRDDSEDMAKTMATLDRALERADAAVKSAPFGCLGRAEKEVESAA